MKAAVLADTGPLYAAVDPDDAYHERSQRELKRHTRDRRDVVIAYPTLLEAYTLVLYRLGDPIASNWLNEILSGAALVNPTPDDYREAVNKVLAFADQRITLFDATVAVLAAHLEIEVWTYDHHFDVMRTAVWR
ncbi:MAG TPA: PIN domain-containing protein [Terriglobia bacterium]|nr:PIN domain-containing protein [Terriglobia bacterium]